MSTPPPIDLDDVRRLPAQFDQPVGGDFIDQNGHMNIGHYFRLSSLAAWELLKALGMDDDYIPRRGLSFFTVEHRLRYLGELREGQRFTVRAGLVGRTGKALHGAAFVVDEEQSRIACVFEAVYVHVSMESRRATAIPGDLTAGLDQTIAAYDDWLPRVATGLSLQR